MRKLTFHITTIMILLLWCYSVQAVVMVFGSADESTFETSVGLKFIDIGFSSGTDTVVNGSIFDPQISFGSPEASVVTTVFHASSNNAITDAGTTPGAIDGEFDGTAFAFSLDFSDATVLQTISLFDVNNNLLASVVAPGPASSFLGVISTIPIKRFVFSNNNMERIFIDEFAAFGEIQQSITEPGVLILFASGLIMLGRIKSYRR